MIIDTMNHILQFQEHQSPTWGPMYPLERDTAANQYYVNYQNNNWDILLYKFNADLSDAEIDTLPHSYDSLCPNLPIVSDTIYVTGCDVITQVPQFPSPAAYNKAKQTVHITAYPNPSGNGRVNFKLQYTQFHRNMQLVVYDMAGSQRLVLPLFTGQKEATASTAGLASGLYIAVVRNEKAVLGKAAFSVEYK